MQENNSLLAYTLGKPGKVILQRPDCMKMFAKMPPDRLKMHQKAFGGRATAQVSVSWTMLKRFTVSNIASSAIFLKFCHNVADKNWIFRVEFEGVALKMFRASNVEDGGLLFITRQWACTFDVTLKRFDSMHECDRQMDGQADKQSHCSIHHD